MFKKFVYNKSKTDTIILLHGLYANSGFWLSYMSYFKGFKLIVYNIDFETFFDDVIFMSEFEKECHQDYINNRVVAVISHSLGTVLADLNFSNKSASLFNICPIALGNRVDSSGFISYTSNKLNLSKSRISDNLFKVDRFYNIVKEKLTLKGTNIIPNNDQYFTYEIPETNAVIFHGDHFEINKAFIDIICVKLKII
jgi:hypothetical protein